MKTTIFRPKNTYGLARRYTHFRGGTRRYYPTDIYGNTYGYFREKMPYLRISTAIPTGQNLDIYIPTPPL